MKHEQIIQAVRSAGGVYLKCGGISDGLTEVMTYDEPLQMDEGRIFPDHSVNLLRFRHNDRSEFYVMVYGDGFGTAIVVYESHDMADQLYSKLVELLE